MFDEPTEDPQERSFSAADRAKDVSDQFRMHAELAAVFEGTRKFDAQVVSGLDPDVARSVQRGVALLEKARKPETPLVSPASYEEAAALLDYPSTKKLTTNDYHVYRRPGEVMVVRWLAGEEVATFYNRLQAHFDAALEGLREDERQANEWRKDPETEAYSKALEAIEVKMEERYLREPLAKLNAFVLSTQTADDMNISYLCEQIMSIAPEELVGSASAPPEDATDSDRAWFFKLFSLRGIVEREERMCFFTYLQKSEDGGW